MATITLYNAGQATFTNGSAAVVGVGTTWGSLIAGDPVFGPDGKIYEVSAVPVDDTHIVLDRAYAGATVAGSVGGTNWNILRASVTRDSVRTASKQLTDVAALYRTIVSATSSDQILKLTRSTTADRAGVQLQNAGVDVFRAGMFEDSNYSIQYKKAGVWTSAFSIDPTSGAWIIAPVPNHPVDGHLYNAWSYSVGTPITSLNQWGGNLYSISQGVTATMNIPAGSAVVQGAALAGYGVSFSNTSSSIGTPPCALGVYAQSAVAVAGSNAFAANFTVLNAYNHGSGLVAYDSNFICGLEIDVNLYQTAPGVDPIIAGGHAVGFLASSGGNHTGMIGQGFRVGQASTAGGTREWGFMTEDGVIGDLGGSLLSGCSRATGDAGSQPIYFKGRLSGTDHYGAIAVGSTGAFVVYSGGGTLSLPSGVTDTVVTRTTTDTLSNKNIAATANTILMPYFSANLQSTITATSTVPVKVPFNIELADSNNWYDNATNFRFKPLLAGKYRIHSQVQVLGTISGADLAIYKNGASYGLSVMQNVTFHTLAIDQIVSFNGSTDYVEIFATLTGSGTLNVLGGTAPIRTWFEAQYIGP